MAEVLKAVWLGGVALAALAALPAAAENLQDPLPPVHGGLGLRSCTGPYIGNGVSPGTCGPVPGAWLAPGAAAENLNLGTGVGTALGNPLNGATGLAGPFTQTGSGAITWSLLARNQTQLNLLDFGADPTGVADSAPAVRAADKECIKTGFRSVYVPQGDYLLSSYDTTTPNGSQGDVVLGDGQKISATVSMAAPTSGTLTGAAITAGVTTSVAFTGAPAANPVVGQYVVAGGAYIGDVASYNALTYTVTLAAPANYNMVGGSTAVFGAKTLTSTTNVFTSDMVGAAIDVQGAGAVKGGPYATTAAAGTGTTATVSISGGATVWVGSYVTVSGMTPAGYNGTYVVTASSAGSVSYANTTTGAQTGAGTVTWGGTLSSEIYAYNSPTSVVLVDFAGTTVVGAQPSLLHIGHARACDFVGEALNTGWNYYGNGNSIAVPKWGARFIQGPGQNRPMFFLPTKAAPATFRNIELQAFGQTGCTAGCAGDGKLYALTADDGSQVPESSFKLINTVVLGGLNGGFYDGSGRGGTVLRDAYFLYSGQTVEDSGVMFNGYDLVADGFGVGSSAGYGVTFNEGSQYELSNWAVWMNNRGVRVNGDHVTYMMSTNLNVQASACDGLVETSTLVGGQNSAGHHFANTVFESNNLAGGACNDISLTDNTNLAMDSVSFMGNYWGGSGRANYNIGVSGSNKSQIALSNVKFGLVPNVSGFTNRQSTILPSNVPVEFTWTPALQGATTAGTVTYTQQVGSWSRSNNEITAHFAMFYSGWSGSPTGQLQMTGLPLPASSASGDVGYCFIGNSGGWVAQSGYTQLVGVTATNSAVVSFFENGSGKYSTSAAAAEMPSGSGALAGTCVYHTDN